MDAAIIGIAREFGPMPDHEADYWAVNQNMTPGLPERVSRRNSLSGLGFQSQPPEVEMSPHLDVFGRPLPQTRRSYHLLYGGYWRLIPVAEMRRGLGGGKGGSELLTSWSSTTQPPHTERPAEYGGASTRKVGHAPTLWRARCNTSGKCGTPRTLADSPAQPLTMLFLRRDAQPLWG